MIFTRFLSRTPLLLLVWLASSVRAQGECSILDANPRNDLGFDGCRGTDDFARACFTSLLDVLYRPENGTISHAIMTHDAYIDRVKSGDLPEIISVSVAAMKCPEVAKPCLPLTAKTLIRVGNEIQSCHLSELQLGDEVVVGMQSTFTGDIRSASDVVTSRIVNFAHRSADDDELVNYVRVRTVSGTEILGSPDHNLFVQFQGRRVGMTFGKLARKFVKAEQEEKPAAEAIDGLYLYSQSGPSQIAAVDIDVLPVGYVSPITESGTMFLQFNDEPGNVNNNKDEEWIEVSCFSSVPDVVAKMGHHIRMLPTYVFGVDANPNKPGVGGGYWMDSLGLIATQFSYMAGYVVDLPKK